MRTDHARSSRVEDYELASARVEWVKHSGCLDLPAQRQALDWHLATREAALAALADGDLPLDGQVA